MIRVCVAGVTGLTGRAVADAVKAADDLELVAGVSRSDWGWFSSVAQALEAVEADVLVDYTHAAVVKQNVVAAIERGVAVVIGRAGCRLPTTRDRRLARRPRRRRCRRQLLPHRGAAPPVLRRGRAPPRDWEVIDYASAGKQDAPSGTSRELAERLDAVAAPRSVSSSTTSTARAKHEARPSPAPRSTRCDSRASRLDGDCLRRRGERLSIRHDAGESAAPYVAGTLLAVRAVAGRIGLTRGLDQLLG